MQYVKTTAPAAAPKYAERFATGVNRSLARMGVPKALDPTGQVVLNVGTRHEQTLSVAHLAQVYEASPGGTWSAEDLVADGIAHGEIRPL